MKLIDVAYYLAESAIRHELGAYPNILKTFGLSRKSINGDDIQSMLDETVG